MAQTAYSIAMQDMGNMIELANSKAKTLISPIYNASGYGLKGDGVTDDTAALQSLVNLAIQEERKAIYFPAGVYYVTAITGAEQVVFFGDNATFTGGYAGSIGQIGGVPEMDQYVPKDEVPYNVLDYSLVGDGTTNDTTALQTLVDLAIAAGRKAIYFPHGTYFVTALTNANQVVFYGDNAEFTGGYSGEITQVGSATDTSTFVLKNTLVYNVRDYGAKGDGSNDVQAFRDCVAAMPAGATLYIPPGEYVWSGTGSELLLVDKVISMVGCGNATKIIVNTTVPTTTDVIRFSPPANVSSTFAYFGNFYIWGPDPVIRYGRHGIHIDVTDPDKHVSNMMIERIFTNGLDGAGVKLTNPTGNDGFYTSTIQDCLLYGGIDLERCGDSVNIYRNVLTGHKTGFKASFVTGAAMITVEKNNITASGGAIDISNGNQVKIRENQIEQVNTYTSDKDASVYLTNCEMCEITNNSMNGHSNVSSNIRIAGTSNNNIIRGNSMIGQTTQHIRLDASTVVGTFIGKEGRFYNASFTEVEFPIVTNSGTRTVGVPVSITLGSGVTNVDAVNFSAPGVKKKTDGRVSLYGFVAVTTITAGALVATIPVGYRPIGKSKLVSCGCRVGSAPGSCLLTVAPTGELAIYMAPASMTQIVLDGAAFDLD